MPKIFTQTILAVLFVGSLSLTISAQQIPVNSLFSEMKWRLVGPFRGGRSVTAVGVRGNPNLFYFGAVGGGVWKSTDAGTTWEPTFEKQSIASIGAVEAAPSDPNIIYVGSGEADMRDDISYGNGIYKSTDTGLTWVNIGLKDTRQIGRIIVDPKDRNIVFVAALGHAYGPNPERGVFKTTDGGKTWNKVLFKDDNTGAIDLAFDPTNSETIYAALWQTRRPPWNVYPASNGSGSGLYKSTDGGATWTHLQKGLPQEGLGRMGIAISASAPQRVYVIADAKDGGVYSSDDGGASFGRTDNEKRVWGRGWYFGGIAADPKNADVVFVSNTSIYKSIDGGKSFVAFKGAPGGDDYHSVWISPEDSARMIVASDQGTIVSLNGGKTWSSWYNQPTGQFYHVTSDDRFPYWIYGSQQDSGSMAVPSRSNFASITERDWRPLEVGGESEYIVPSGTDANVLFGGTVSRYQWAQMQEQDVSPTLGREGNFRSIWTLPLAISQADKHKIYFAHQMLFRSVTDGKSWDIISPDLTRVNPAIPETLDAGTAKYGLDSPRKGVIYAIAPSPLDANLVWVGTDDGSIHRTDDDGLHWHNVTPAALSDWSKVGTIEASHFDKNVAYAAIDRHRLEDLQPHILRTRDGGKSWQPNSEGIPEGAYVNVVREDLERKGLLYAGTELGIYLSLDDGDHWEPLQLNLPVASIRDISVRHDDLVVATHGRAFWVLDDISPLRQWGTKSDSSQALLFKPQPAYRIRPGTDRATPYPPEIPHGDNPPDGALINYYLKSASKGSVTLEILDAKGNLVRRYASDEKVVPVDEKTLDIPMYWTKKQTVLANSPGLHRFAWDLHYASPLPAGSMPSRRGGVGPFALPGKYQARLMVEGTPYVQDLNLALDPRVKVSADDLQKQFDASQRASSALAEVAQATAQAASVQKQIAELLGKVKHDQSLSSALNTFSQRLTSIDGEQAPPYGSVVERNNTDNTSLTYLNAALNELLGALQSADAAPTKEQSVALDKFASTSRKTLGQWRSFLASDLPAMNAQLKSARQAGLTFSPAE